MANMIKFEVMRETTTCTLAGCERTHVAKGLCSLHYYRLKRNGTTDEPPRRGRSADFMEAIRPVVEPREVTCGHPERTHYAKGMCASCYNKASGHAKRWREANPERFAASVRRSQLKRYGITPGRYDELLEAQGGVCAICKQGDKKGRRLAVDHVHETGRVRGLLCRRCNQGLGLFGDDAELFETAASYLESLN